MTTHIQRGMLRVLMHDLIAHEPAVHYAQVRPMRNVRLSAPHFPMTMDCSEAVTCLCKWAGLKDPNGNAFNGKGYTGTLLAHLPHYSDPANADVGAIVIFGPGSGDHACMVLESGTDPLLFSHGQERGPIAIRLSVERKFHRSPVTFLSIANL